MRSTLEISAIMALLTAATEAIPKEEETHLASQRKEKK
jgi:hypothetical protein